MQTLWDYLVELGRRMSDRALSDIRSKADWERVRSERRREFFEMVGLDPMPERHPLRPRLHGQTQGDGYTIHRVSFESLPSVSVTANLYVPEGLSTPSPAVLYVCGHGLIGTVHYQAQGDLWARRGYVCLLVDTLEQGDSLGDHHGIHSQRHYDWVDRGYAASGGELWNSLRALDFLCSREEVDAQRVGVTGISGGGALSWWVGIADERVRAMAPVCGTSTLASYLSERNVNGHCDCMLYHNLYQREISEVGALCAPRPLLVNAAREDSLFLPAAYRRVVEQIRRVYGFYGCEDSCQLCEYPGPHAYSKPAHEAIQEWFDRHVAGWQKPLLQPREPRYSDRELTVFGGSPPSEDRIALMPLLISRPGRVPHRDTLSEWENVRAEKVALLRKKVFRHFPEQPETLDVETVADWEYHNGTRLLVRDFTTEDRIRLRARMLIPRGASDVMLVGLMGPGDILDYFAGAISGIASPHAACAVEARGTGVSSWHPNQTWQVLRGGLLVGRTVASLQVWDLLRTVELVRSMQGVPSKRIFTYGKGEAGVLALYAAALDERIAGVLAESPSGTHADGPHLLNVLRVMDIPQAAAMAVPRPVGLVNAPVRPFHWTRRLYDRLGIGGKLVTGDIAQAVFQQMIEK
ncbi:MAG: acetylxylan esterase [Planctomycetes bacterium]|nr:acetylxylan esterase [Planctomycetota bacterium]